MLHPRAQQILELLQRHHGLPPSYREIAIGVGLSSVSTVQSHLQRLEQLGLVRRGTGMFHRCWVANGEAEIIEASACSPAEVQRAYQAGLREGWALGCNLDEPGLARAKDGGYSRFRKLKETAKARG